MGTPQFLYVFKIKSFVLHPGLYFNDMTSLYFLKVASHFKWHVPISISATQQHELHGSTETLNAYLYKFTTQYI